ncbi:MAG: PAC2 family protein, partial [Pseudonocardiaceae bacterium]
MTYPDTPGSDSDTSLPQLTSPVLVAAFEGWNDAGDAASTAIEHLQLSWDATPLAELDPEAYY